VVGGGTGIGDGDPIDEITAPLGTVDDAGDTGGLGEADAVVVPG